MQRICQNCAFPRLPYYEKCLHCGKLLLTPEEAADERARWELLPESERLKAEDEVAKKYAHMQELHAALGFARQARDAGILSAIFALAAAFLCPSYSTGQQAALAGAGLVAGVLVCFLVHWRRGGIWWGMALSGGAYGLLYFGDLNLSPQEGINATSVLYAFLQLLPGAFGVALSGSLLGAIVARDYRRAIEE